MVPYPLAEVFRMRPHYCLEHHRLPKTSHFTLAFHEGFLLRIHGRSMAFRHPDQPWHSFGVPAPFRREHLHETSRILVRQCETGRRTENGAVSLKAVDTFLHASLDHDVPVAFLSLDPGKEPLVDEWHWVTLIGIDEIQGGDFPP